jgi:hypothetical protein
MNLKFDGVLWLLVFLSLGILNCYFGYRLFIITVGVIGFLLAGALGYVIGDFLGSHVIALVLALGLGLLGAWGSITAYYAFIFVIGGFGFAFLAAFLLGIQRENISILIPLIAGLIGGLLALWLQRIIIIFATAYQGALSSVLAVAALISGGGIMAYRRLLNGVLGGDLGRTGGLWFYLGALAWLILFVSGLITQSFSKKEMLRQSKIKESDPQD